MARTQYGPISAIVRVEQTSDATCWLVVRLEREGVVVWSMERHVVLWAATSPGSTAPQRKKRGGGADHVLCRRSGRRAPSAEPVDVTLPICGTQHGISAVASDLHISMRRSTRLAERVATYIAVALMLTLVAAIPVILLSGREQVVARLPAPLELPSRNSHALLLLPANDAEIPVPSTLPLSLAVSTSSHSSQSAVTRQGHGHVSFGHAGQARSLAKPMKGKRSNSSTRKLPIDSTETSSAVEQGSLSKTPNAIVALEATLTQCAEQSIFARTWCEHRARRHYCEGQWGLRPACPTDAPEAFRYSSAN
jgi:hypothetical protein